MMLVIDFKGRLPCVAEFTIVKFHWLNSLRDETAAVRAPHFISWKSRAILLSL
jgi:hypothetical protein